MFPTLVRIPVPFTDAIVPIHTYGVMIAIGFIIAMSVAQRLASREKLPAVRIADLAFYLLIWGLIGARALFVITRWEYFSQNPEAIIRFWEGGLVFFGGLISATLFAIYFIRKHQLSPWKTADVLVPGLVINHSLGRLGCLASGCCYGKPTGTDFGIVFHSELVDSSLHGVHLHPTQIYESVSLFLLFLGLLWIFRRKQFDGQVVLTYFIVYPIIRSIIEVFRGDLIRGFVIDGILSTSQFISLLVFGMAMATLIWRIRQKNAST